MRCCSAFYRLREVVVPAFEVTNSACVLVFWLLVLLLVLWCWVWNKTVNHQFLAPHQHQVTISLHSLSPLHLPIHLSRLPYPVTHCNTGSPLEHSLSWSPSSAMAATKPSRKTKLMLMQQNVVAAMQ